MTMITAVSMKNSPRASNSHVLLDSLFCVFCWNRPERIQLITSTLLFGYFSFYFHYRCLRYNITHNVFLLPLLTDYDNYYNYKELTLQVVVLKGHTWPIKSMSNCQLGWRYVMRSLKKALLRLCTTLACFPPRLPRLTKTFLLWF